MEFGKQRCTAIVMNSSLSGSRPGTKGYGVHCHLSIFICTFSPLHLSCCSQCGRVCTLSMSILTVIACWHDIVGTFCTEIHQDCHEAPVRVRAESWLVRIWLSSKGKAAQHSVNPIDWAAPALLQLVQSVSQLIRVVRQILTWMIDCKSGFCPSSHVNKEKKKAANVGWLHFSDVLSWSLWSRLTPLIIQETLQISRKPPI